MKQPEFDTDCSFNESALICPNCGGNYLHLRSVETFDRTEDAKTGQHVTVTFKGVKMDSDLTGNPSRRRDGILLHFSCELCTKEDDVFTLGISQHKGYTFVGWQDK